VLEPLKSLGDKLLILRDVDQVRCDESGINANFDGASGAFTAEPPQGEAKSGGPSIDQVIRRAHYPNGLPDGMVPTLLGGTFFRRSRVSRYVHSYNPDGTVAGTMQEKPRDLFERVFGSVSFLDESSARERHLKRSVLDSVVGQYKYYTGNRSPLGSVSKGASPSTSIAFASSNNEPSPCRMPLETGRKCRQRRISLTVGLLILVAKEST